MMPVTRRITLDIEQAMVGPDGMRDFCWPLPIDASVPVREALFKGLLSLIREADPLDQDARVLRMVHQYLVTEALQLFEAASLLHAFAKIGVKPEVPPRFAMLKALQNGIEPPCGLLTRFAVPSFGRKVPMVLKRMMRGIEWNGDSLGRLAGALRPWRGRNDVFTPDVGSLMVAHARCEGRVLRFSSYPDWFGPLPSGVRDSVAEIEPTGLLKNVPTLVECAFEVGGLVPDRWVTGWARRWLGLVGAFVRFHCTALAGRRLPHEMWFNSAGSTLWGRMLAVEIRARGGRIVSHDHGFGNAQIEQSSHHFTEFHFSDEFYTYNRLQAEVRLREMRPDLLLDKTPPVVTSPPIGNTEIPVPGTGRRIMRRGPIRRLLYLPTAFHGMRTRLRPIIPDPVALDFQARLFGFLRAQGIDVLYKPHPEGASKAPAGFAEGFGFTTDTRRFEQVDWPCDAYLVDFLSSSTTRQVLDSELPVIFLNFPYPKLLPQARALLERRCFFVGVHFDDNNRAHADWNSLHAALNAPEHELDMTFPDAYYAGI